MTAVGEPVTALPKKVLMELPVFSSMTSAEKVVSLTSVEIAIQ